MRRILFIAHHFPPIGGSGVQRSVKFVKYLPDFGVLPTVVTGPGRTGGFSTPEDQSMVPEIPAAVRIFRSMGCIPKELTRKSRHAANGGDNGLVQAGEDAAKQCQPQCILVTVSPFQDTKVAAELSRQLQIPWIADLRDPWALDEYEVFRTRWHRSLARRQMRRSLASASRVIMNTPEAANRFRSAFPELGRIPVTALTNGYDAEDFPQPAPEVDATCFTIVHSGYLRTRPGLHQRRHALQYRLLGRTEPGTTILPRSHYYLLQALARWTKDQPKIRGCVRIVLVGATTEEDRNIVKQSSVADMVELRGYLSHAESLSIVRNAGLLFLPMHGLPSNRRATIVPGKAYEYMATGRPILAPVPQGDTRDFLLQAGTGLLCSPNDVDNMVRILKAQFGAWQARQSTVSWNRDYVEQFERRRLTARLASVVIDTCGPMQTVVAAHEAQQTNVS